MQPNDQQGYYQPGNNQPVPPAAPPQPGAVVQPLSQQPTQIDPAAMQAALNEPSSQPVAPSQPPQPQSVQPPVQPTEQPAAQQNPVEYNDIDSDEELPDEAPISWAAHEYIHQEKGTMWFVLFVVIVLALIGVSIWTQAWTFTGLILVISVAIVILSRRPPRELSYSLDDEGLRIEDKLHKFDNFKSFGIIRDGDEFSVMLIPIQRFQPGVTVYFPEDAGEEIVDLLGSRLPMKDLKLDAVDKVVRLLRL